MSYWPSTTTKWPRWKIEMPSLCDTCKAPGSCCKGFVLTDETGNEVPG